MPARLQTKKRSKLWYFHRLSGNETSIVNFSKAFQTGHLVPDLFIPTCLPPLSTGLTLDFKLCFQTPMPEIKTTPSKRGGGGHRYWSAHLFIYTVDLNSSRLQATVFKVCPTSVLVVSFRIIDFSCRLSWSDGCCLPKVREKKVIAFHCDPIG